MEPAGKLSGGDALHQLVERIKRLEREIARQALRLKALELNGSDGASVQKAYLETLHRLKEDYLAELATSRAAKASKSGSLGAKKPT